MTREEFIEEMNGQLKLVRTEYNFTQDVMAKVLGMAMRRVLDGRRKVICIDGIKVEQGDYVDMGRPVLDGLVIPIVVKTLLFG